jgi:two-component system, chemotaxis family, protein-glutamate methylesterase/glutaminase
MPHARDVIVIGGSAGAIEALLHVAGELPATLAARIFITVHIPTAATSVLPRVLERAGGLRARHPADGEATQPALMYVAPPDFHLLVKRGRVRVVRGPRENGYRPAIDPLFRSAAASYGARVIGVILSGNLDDGSAGVAAIHAAGGAVVIQDPAEAMYGGMPRNALASVPTADVLPLHRIADHLVRMLTAPAPQGADMTLRETDTHQPDTKDPVELDTDGSESFSKLGAPTGLTCPECHGGIFELGPRSGGAPPYRCRVGHAFSAATLFAEQKAGLEVALWTAVRALEESAELARRMESRARGRTNTRAAEMYVREARVYDERARTIREVLATALPTLGEGSGSAVPGYADD